MTNKILFLKWMKNLFYVQCIALIGMMIGQLSFIGSWFEWITNLITLAEVYCLYQLIPVNERYRKAFKFSGIAVGLTIVKNVTSLDLFSIVISICSLVGLYQEFSGHAEVLLTIDNKLSKKWHTLFNWNLFGSIIVALISVPVIMLAAIVTVFDSDLLGIFAAGIVVVYTVIIQIVYLIYLKRTHDVCEKYEHWVEDIV